MIDVIELNQQNTTYRKSHGMAIKNIWTSKKRTQLFQTIIVSTYMQNCQAVLQASCCNESRNRLEDHGFPASLDLSSLHWQTSQTLSEV